MIGGARAFDPRDCFVGACTVSTAEARFGTAVVRAPMLRDMPAELACCTAPLWVLVVEQAIALAECIRGCPEAAHGIARGRRYTLVVALTAACRTIVCGGLAGNAAYIAVCTRRALVLAPVPLSDRLPVFGPAVA